MITVKLSQSSKNLFFKKLGQLGYLGFGFFGIFKGFCKHFYGGFWDFFLGGEGFSWLIYMSSCLLHMAKLYQYLQICRFKGLKKFAMINIS